MREHRATLLADGFKFLEAPKWHDGQLWVSDVFDNRVFALTPDGERREVCFVPARPSGQGFLPDGRHIVVSAADCRLVEVRDGNLSTYADLSSYAAGYVNDFAIDADGRIYVGDFGYDYDAGEARKTTKLHRVDPDGYITAVADGVDFPNGSVIVDDGGTLIVAETWEGRIAAFDLDAQGNLSNRRVFADLSDRFPDGLCADAEGAIWVGCFNTGEFLRVLDGGEITDVFRFDGSAISCVLGGEDGKTLFMTTFLGPSDEIATEKRKSAVFMARVDVGGPRP
ncbi:SMP-30/gluconolactonase/LRE family protein [Paragemmobacter straminiformis]|uniref:SMP-30/gluconolactonase/LRE family protein n=1 Tax=Paragemmobacter straminiformis TaxID=2045119 RepID=A0A842I566_9RHOB|nr:SMP-30/gluconolactonase/LRE family protein [Gemmobacter straminiformis]MBC2834517.1 SMP-30/gluconolactonase/LRE family protein [Gemmobacter straminiformis]